MALTPTNGVALRTPASPTSGGYLTIMAARVVSIDRDNNVATVVDQAAQMRDLPIRILGKPLSGPQTGETWILTSLFGDWAFALQIGSQARGGASTDRPLDPDPYQSYFDTTLNKPIWFNGSAWVDASGTAV